MATNERLDIPVIFVQTDLGGSEDIDKRRKAIKEQEGKLVLICDLHSSESLPISDKGKTYRLGIAKTIPGDEGRYKLRFPWQTGNREVTLHYNDLLGLMHGEITAFIHPP